MAEHKTEGLDQMQDRWYIYHAETNAVRIYNNTTCSTEEPTVADYTAIIRQLEDKLKRQTDAVKATQEHLDAIRALSKPEKTK